MHLKIFYNLQDVEKFLQLYCVKECNIVITPQGEYFIWVDNIKDALEDVLCPHCQKYTDASGHFCAWCGNELYSESELNVNQDNMR